MNSHRLPAPLVRLGICSAALFTLGAMTSAQSNPVTKRMEPVSIGTGDVSNIGFVTETISAFYVSKPGAEWLRLFFDDVELSGSIQAGTGSYLKITSLEDGYHQILDAVTIEEWHHTSAYFNGDLLQVELISFPGTGNNSVSVDNIAVGLAPPPVQESICGVDDRVFSNDARVSRLLPVGCTGWLIDDSCGCLLTAGHCTFAISVVQFNVPISNGNGSLNNPPPSDQYSLDSSSLQSNGGQGIGNDWGYFGVFPNSNTGLTPAEAQGAVFTLADPPAWNSSLEVRITGFGTDSGTSNQAQQTHKGPWLNYNQGSNRLQYQTDTTGGSSGSPVIQEQAGVAMGIHTHAGCSSTSGNNGTASVHPGLVAALANPQGVCKNQAPVTCAAVPSSSISNGTGVNPVCLSALNDPALGTDWTLMLDTSAIAGGNFAGYQIRQTGVPQILPIGEVFIDLNAPIILQDAGNGPLFDVALPNSLNLAGISATVQGFVGVNGEIQQLCNALTFTLGCAQ